ncbi:MAG: SDR family NAD(P)-dependent oxidoreductase [Patescibacteria group bacterium]|jgi:NAD(P)-dependent dehydrogenase (short-subunit alcohol dehydrogenase family)
MLKNKTAIVTGAGQGIGKGIALALAKEGCNVVVSDINQETCEQVVAEIVKLGVQSIAIKCDVSKKAEVDNLAKVASEKFNQINILVNNAGIFPSIPFAKMTEADWDKVIDINLKSMFLTSQAISSEMPEGGKIVDISSIASIVGFEGLVHYCASKGGVNGMIRALALELAPKKINVNAVAPGMIKTPGATQVMDEKALAQMIAMVPQKRIGTPEDIANAVVFLASDKSDYITGQVIVVDGGWTLR